MEEMMMLRKHMANSNSSAALSMNKNSHTISKAKPKIRIIHIFAPEVIKTDVENFRELVQRLTGKPTDHQKVCKKKGRGNKNNGRREEARIVCDEKGAVVMRSGLERVKEEGEEMWNGENSGGFLNGFADLDGLIQELGEFPFLPMDAASHHMHAFEETQLA